MERRGSWSCVSHTESCTGRAIPCAFQVKVLVLHSRHPTTFDLSASWDPIMIIVPTAARWQRLWAAAAPAATAAPRARRRGRPRRRRHGAPMYYHHVLVAHLEVGVPCFESVRSCFLIVLPWSGLRRLHCRSVLRDGYIPGLVPEGMRTTRLLGVTLGLALLGALLRIEPLATPVRSPTSSASLGTGFHDDAMALWWASRVRTGSENQSHAPWTCGACVLDPLVYPDVYCAPPKPTAPLASTFDGRIVVPSMSDLSRLDAAGGEEPSGGMADVIAALPSSRSRASRRLNRVQYTILHPAGLDESSSRVRRTSTCDWRAWRLFHAPKPRCYCV